MESPEITVKRASLTDEVSLALIGALNAELAEMYPEPGACHFRLDPDEVAEGRGTFLVASVGGVPTGCGAFRVLDDGSAELKRMYVAPEARGQGLGRRLVAELEASARALGVRRLVLETGVKQAVAIGLYRSAGFESIPPFGEYCLSPDTSVCLAKDLAAQGDERS
jgi:GNAT superfamily N-acetyltransferase